MEQDLCANCGHWREEHYDMSGAFWAEARFGCVSYQGTVPSPDRRSRKQEQLAKVMNHGAAGGAPEPEY